MDNSAWTSVGETNIGTVRKVNEDDLLQASHASLWCVADGMGGHERGDVASQMITSHLNDLVENSISPLTVDSVMQCIQEVNTALVDMARSQNSVIGSTVVVLFLEKTKAHFIWAGDSRIYRIRDDSVKRITRDHSQVEDMVDAGLIKPEEAESHPKANVITRAVGASDELELAIRTLDLEDKDQFLLCSDGLNKVLDDRELGYALQSLSNNICSRLIEVALSRRAKDNVTVIVVRKEQQSGSEILHETLPLDATLPLK